MPIIPIAVSLIGTLVPELLKLFGNNKQAEVAEKVINIARQVTGEVSPDDASTKILADPKLAFEFKQAVMAQQLELEKIGLQRETLYVQDTQDARRYRDQQTFVTGNLILLSFTIIMGCVLWGAYTLITGAVQFDQATLTAVIGLVGAIVGYFAANAQQVVGFLFGSSQGSIAKTDSLADSINQFSKRK